MVITATSRAIRGHASHHRSGERSPRQLSRTQDHPGGCHGAGLQDRFSSRRRNSSLTRIPSCCRGHSAGQTERSAEQTGCCRRPRKTPHNGTSPSTGFTHAPEPRLVGADIFWNRSLRLVLETVDRRRNPRQLKGVLTPSVLEVVAQLYTSDSSARKLGGAAVHRTHVQAVSESTAEVCATYTRGTQTFAVAGRIDHTDETGWTVTALHVV